MKQVLLITLLIALSFCAFSEEDHRAIWKDTELTDSVRLRSLHKLIWAEYLFVNPDSARILSEAEFQLAAETGLQSYMAKGLNNQGIAFDIQGDSRSVEFYRKAAVIYESIPDSTQYAFVLMNIGTYFHHRAESDSAYANLEHSLAIFQSLGDEEGIAACEINLANLLAEEYRAKEAINHLISALEYSRKSGNKRYIISCLNNIGLLYQNMEDFDQALNYYEKCLPELDENDLQTQASVLHNMGSIYYMRNQYDSARILHQLALDMALQMEDHHQAANGLSSIGNVVGDLGDMARDSGNMSAALVNYAEAMELYRRSLDHRIKGGDKEGEASSLNKIALTYLDLNELTKAAEYGRKAEAIALEHGLPKEERDAVHTLYQTRRKQGNAKAAIGYFERYITLQDSIVNMENQSEMIRKEYEFEYRQQQFADSMAEVEAERIELENKEMMLVQKRYRNRIQYSGIILLVLLLGALIALSGKINISPNVAEGLIFIFFILLFEFILVVMDPYVDEWSNGEVAYKLAINSVFALVVFFGHQFFEGRLKAIFVKRKEC